MATKIEENRNSMRMTSEMMQQQQRLAATRSATSNSSIVLSQRDQTASRTKYHYQQQHQASQKRSFRNKLQQGSFYQNVAARQQAVSGQQQLEQPCDQLERATASTGDQRQEPAGRLLGGDNELEQVARDTGAPVSLAAVLAPGELVDVAGEQRDGKQHVGPVMGIFFKVWSLVKVTKVRHQSKMRRQNSEDASQFRYISGDQLQAPQGLAPSVSASGSGQRRHPAGEQRDHFRRAGSQPAPSMMGGDHSSSRLQVTPPPGPLATATTNSSSSGVSSASGNLVGVNACTEPEVASGWSAAKRTAHSATRLHQRQEEEEEVAARQARAQSETKQPVDAVLLQQRRRSIAANQRRATSENDHVDGRKFRRNSDTLSASKQTVSSDGRLAKLSSVDGVRCLEEDSEDANDIYSTPNDSIKSVSGGAQLQLQPLPTERTKQYGEHAPLQQATVSQTKPMIKSFSTNNFAQLIKQTSSKSKKLISDVPKNILAANLGAQQQSRPSGSRFFISSSSSEESNPPSNSVVTSTSHKENQQQVRPTRSNDTQQVKIPLQFGLHQHQATRARGQRPDSLHLAPPITIGQQRPMWNLNSTPNLVDPLTPTVTMLDSNRAPTVAAMSPLVPIATPPNGGLLNEDPDRRSDCLRHFAHYKKSPSLYEMSANPASGAKCGTRFTSRFPVALQPRQQQFHYANQRAIVESQTSRLALPRLRSFHPISQARDTLREMEDTTTTRAVPSSVSLHDCKLSSLKQDGTELKQQQSFISRAQMATSPFEGTSIESESEHSLRKSDPDSEYRLTRMLLKFGANPTVKDERGNTAVMHSIMSDNFAALKCLIEHGVELNELNEAQQSALDLISAKTPNETRLEMFRLLIENNADLDQVRPGDGSRLLDRLIGEHQPPGADKIPYIDCLLHNGAKLGSSTWAAAQGKHEIQLRLLRKLCQDGYFLYKKSAIEAAVYRFEYALKRIAELEQQLLSSAEKVCCHSQNKSIDLIENNLQAKATQQVKYQTYLGLSRCERKRRFFKRALEFAHMSILVDSTSYEGYYSKAHILKDIGQFDDSLLAIEQTTRLVERSIDIVKNELSELQTQEESIVFDGCFSMHDPGRSNWIEAQRIELINNLDYLEEAKKHIFKLRNEIIDDKLSKLTEAG